MVTEAPLAEEFGYHRISMGETTNWNDVPLLAVVASETDSIGISDDVVSPFGCSSILLAQTALTLREITDWPDANGLGHEPGDG